MTFPALTRRGLWRARGALAIGLALGVGVSVLLAVGLGVSRADEPHEPRPGDISAKLPELSQRPLDAIEAEIRMSRAEADDLERRVRILGDAREYRKDHLRKRLRALYKLSQGGLLQLVLGAESLHDLYLRRDGARRIIHRDLEELEALRDELGELAGERQELADRIGRIAQLEKEAAHARAKIQAGEGRQLFGLANQRGALVRPVVPGATLTQFGRRLYDRGLELFQHGVELSAEPGNAVFSVAEGQVRYTGEVPGLGHGVIVEHQGGYLSLYARIEQISVVAGDSVHAGTALGRAVYPRIYFQLALGDLPLDPEPWFADPIRRRRPPAP